MSVDVFRRFVLIVACSAYVLGLALVWEWFGWLVMLVTYLGGLVFAVALSVEPTTSRPRPTFDDEAKLPEGLSIRDIRERARERGGG